MPAAPAASPGRPRERAAYAKAWKKVGKVPATTTTTRPCAIMTDLLGMDERRRSIAGMLDITPWADRVRVIDAAHAGRGEIPALG